MTAEKDWAEEEARKLVTDNRCWVGGYDYVDDPDQATKDIAIALRVAEARGFKRGVEHAAEHFDRSYAAGNYKDSSHWAAREIRALLREEK